MIHAYDEYYMPTIREKVARIFELAVFYLKKDIDDFANLFIESSLARAFEINNGKYTLGKSSIELTELILNEEINGFEIAQEATPEYWVGYVLAYVSWYYNVTYKELIDAIPCSKLINYYKVYHEMNITRVLDLYKDKLVFESKLKLYREKKKYSQSVLALLSNVPIRTIRSYEQNKSDICKAQYETLYKLSKVLDCSVDDLVL